MRAPRELYPLHHVIITSSDQRGTNYLILKTIVANSSQETFKDQLWKLMLAKISQNHQFVFLLRRQFLFKQGSGSSALLSGAAQGYPLTSGTVYSPPPRPLPRSSVTRPLFTFNKPHRCCNWKCTALSASLLTLTLALLLTYVIGESCKTSPVIFMFQTFNVFEVGWEGLVKEVAG